MNALGPRAEVQREPAWRRLVVVGRDDEQAVDAAALGRSRVLDRGARAVRAYSRDHAESSPRALHGDREETFALFFRQGRPFSRRARDDETVRAAGRVPIDQLPEGG